MARADRGRCHDIDVAACGTCSMELRANAKFCDECGSPVTHSMDIAAAVGPERLREIMTELVDRATAVVKRYGGAVDKFTGDGIMALFGAPVALEISETREHIAMAKAMARELVGGLG